MKTFGSKQNCEVSPKMTISKGFRFSWSCSNSLGAGKIHHRWDCQTIENGIRLATLECQNGPAIKIADLALGGHMIDMMQRGHQAWLEGIRCRLEDSKWSIR